MNVTDEEVTAAFEQSRADLQKRPATVTFRQIIVAPKPSPAAKAKAKAQRRFVARRDQKGRRLRADRQARVDGSRHEAARRRPRLESSRQRTRSRVRSDDVRASSGRGEPGDRDAVRISHHSRRSRAVGGSEGAPHPHRAGDRLRRRCRARKWKRTRLPRSGDAGCPYDSLVAKHHDATEEKGVLQPFIRDSLPASYQAALAGAKAGTITDPFQLANPRGAPKFAVLQVVTATEAGRVRSEQRSASRFAPSSSEERSISAAARRSAKADLRVASGCREVKARLAMTVG